MTAPVWSTVMVTGHRPQHMPEECHDWVQRELDRVAVKLRDQHRTERGYTGMALGPDQWWAGRLHRIGVPYIAHIPYPQQPAPKWSKAQQAQWEHLRGLAAGEHVYGDLDDAAPSDRRRLATVLLHKRNDGMLRGVDTFPAADVVVACWMPSKRDGGTFSAVEKAYRRCLPVILLNPETLTVTMPTRQRLAVLLGKTIPQPHQPALGDAHDR